jgi:hypothetical protein
MKDYFGPYNQSLNKRAPRSARRARKPLQDDWIKGPRRGIWIKCTYVKKCSFEWQYFGGRQWAECPICHSAMRLPIARRNFIQNKEDLNIRAKKNDRSTTLSKQRTTIK